MEILIMLWIYSLRLSFVAKRTQLKVCSAKGTIHPAGVTAVLPGDSRHVPSKCLVATARLQWHIIHTASIKHDHNIPFSHFTCLLKRHFWVASAELKTTCVTCLSYNWAPVSPSPTVLPCSHYKHKIHVFPLCVVCKLVFLLSRWLKKAVLTVKCNVNKI